MVAIASDYATLDTGRLRFYYGYEETDSNGDWCFAVEYNGVEQMRIPSSGLKCDKFEVTECLLTGIGMWLQRKTGVLQ